MRWLTVVLGLGVASCGAWADDRPTFMGRTLAAPMSHLGAPWLLRPEREREEQPEQLFAAMDLRRGHVVCDLGVGNGYHALRLAPRVKEVVGVDIQPEMLALLRARVAEAGVDNITPVLGTPTDPGLGDARCDRILLVDVYHEFSDPAAMLAALRRALKPGGEAVLVEFRAEDPSVLIKPLHTMTKAQALAEWTAHGFALARAFDGLPWQHVLVFVAAGEPPARLKAL